MIAVDTNVVVRLVVGDDERQVAVALDLLARERVFVGLTVLLETEWVLRSRFGFDRARICDALSGIASLEPVTVEAAEDVRWALARYAEGGELADYIHVIAARPLGRFATFDRKLAQRLGDGSPIEIGLLR